MICNSHVGRLVRLNFRRTLRGVPFWVCLAASWALYAFTCSGLSYNALEGYMRHWDYADTLIFINPPFCERDQWGYETRGALSLITID